jgi:uncharacterized protein
MKMLRVLLGEDFIKARKAWLYPTEPMQGLLRSLIVVVPIAAFYLVLQGAFTILFDVLIYGADQQSILNGISGLKAQDFTNADTFNMMKSTILSIFPAALPCTILAVLASHLGLVQSKGTIPLHWPKIGALGWLSILIFFLVSMMVLTQVLALAVPSHWVESGPLEKSIALLANDKALAPYILAGAVLGAPLIEEVLFRGILFAGLINTALGRVGTVIVTSIAWSALHLLGGTPLFSVGLLVLMGLVLGVLLLRFGSLWVTIACHASWNLMSTLLLFQLGSGQ